MWTEERVEKLKALRSAGYSAGIIANELGGVSRSAVLGKLHRLGLFGSHKAGKRHKGGPKPNPRVEALAMPVRKMSAAPLPLPQEDAPKGPLVSFADLEPHHCRAIYGHPKDGGEWGYCGCERVPGSSYCAEHMQRFYFTWAPKAKAEQREKVPA